MLLKPNRCLLEVESRFKLPEKIHPQQTIYLAAQRNCMSQHWKLLDELP